MNLKQTLIAAKALIDSPEKWMQDEFHNGGTNDILGSYGDGATCFCALGAIAKAGDLPMYNAPEYDRALCEAAQDLFNFDFQGRSFAVFNDTRSHDDVMKVFDKAINDAREDQ